MLIDFDSGTDPGRDCAEQIARAADRAASLTGQLLAFSRKQVLRPQLIDLNEIVEGMATMLRRMLGEDVVLSTALDPDARPTLADPTQLEQVVLNLAINARDAMPDGGSLVRARRRASSTRTTSCRIPTSRRARYVRCACAIPAPASTRGSPTRFRALLHHQARGKGTGLGLDRLRHRPPERRRHLDLFTRPSARAPASRSACRLPATPRSQVLRPNAAVRAGRLPPSNSTPRIRGQLSATFSTPKRP